MIKKKNNNLFYFCSTFYFYIRFREWQNLDLSIFLLLIFTYFNSKSTAGGTSKSTEISLETKAFFNV